MALVRSPTVSARQDLAVFVLGREKIKYAFGNKGYGVPVYLGVCSVILREMNDPTLEIMYLQQVKIFSKDRKAWCQLVAKAKIYIKKLGILLFSLKCL